MQLCRVSALFSHSGVPRRKNLEKRVVIVNVVPSASPERSRWLGVPGGRRNGAIRLSAACEKQKHLPEWRLVQQQGSQQQQMISALSRQWHSHPLGNCCCGRSTGNLGKISCLSARLKKRGSEGSMHMHWHLNYPLLLSDHS